MSKICLKKSLKSKPFFASSQGVEGSVDLTFCKKKQLVAKWIPDSPVSRGARSSIWTLYKVLWQQLANECVENWKLRSIKKGKNGIYLRLIFIAANGSLACLMVMTFSPKQDNVAPATSTHFTCRWLNWIFRLLYLQSPPKGATIPYRPKPQVNGPVILANGQAYTVSAGFANLSPQMDKLTICFSPRCRSKGTLLYQHKR